MIEIKRKDRIPDDRSLVVAHDGGKYADTDLILCADAGNPDEPTMQLQAQYIKYGPLVYQFNTPEELGAAIFALDPDSTHDAVMLYKEEASRKKARETGTLEPENPVEAPDKTEPEPEQKEEEEETIEEPVREAEEPPVEEPAEPVGESEEPLEPEAPAPEEGAVLGEASDEPSVPEAPPLIEESAFDPIEGGELPDAPLDAAVDISTTTTE